MPAFDGNRRRISQAPDARPHLSIVEAEAPCSPNDQHLAVDAPEPGQYLLLVVAHSESIPMRGIESELHTSGDRPGSKARHVQRHFLAQAGVILSNARGCRLDRRIGFLSPGPAEIQRES